MLNQKDLKNPLVYFDSAATSLKPQSVIDRMVRFYNSQTSNVHRGVHNVGSQVTADFENVREMTRKFLGANSVEEIIFTRGTTEAINLVATSYGETFLKSGDEIILTEMEHHANIVPWQMLQVKKDLSIKVIPILENGDLDLEKLPSLLSPRTKILALTHCSNTLGTINDVKRAITMARVQKDCRVLVDGAQMVTSHAVDVSDLDCDFYCFSGHKIFGPSGIGVLYGKKHLLDSMPPYQGGGSMISKVDFSGTTYNTLPYKFEAGTPDIEGVLGLGAAIQFVGEIGYKDIYSRKNQLLEILNRGLKEMPEIEIYASPRERTSIVSFNLRGAHSSDVGTILDQNGIAVRTGHHCNQPLMKRLGITGTVRASLSIYNTEQEIELFIRVMKTAKDFLL